MTKTRALVLAFFSTMMASAVLLPQFRVQENSTFTELEAMRVSPAVLSDSIPKEILNRLGLGKVQGVQVQLNNHSVVQYFAYTCDRDALLKVIPTIPFEITQGLSDATYRHVDFSELAFDRANATDAEIETAPEFFSATPDEYDAVEFIKAPYRHLLLFNKRDHSVIHKVEHS